jgi:hypothetical protein
MVGSGELGLDAKVALVREVQGRAQLKQGR